MKPCIPTVNDILRKWRSKTSHVGKVTILLFWRHTWILLLVSCVLLLALRKRSRETFTQTPWAHNCTSVRFGGDISVGSVIYTFNSPSRETVCEGVGEGTFAMEYLRRATFRAAVRSLGATFRATVLLAVVPRVIVFMHYVEILIQLPCRRVTFYYVILEKWCYTR